MGRAITILKHYFKVKVGGKISIIKVNRNYNVKLTFLSINELH